MIAFFAPYAVAGVIALISAIALVRFRLWRGNSVIGSQLSPRRPEDLP